MKKGMGLCVNACVLPDHFVTGAKVATRDSERYAFNLSKRKHVLKILILFFLTLMALVANASSRKTFVSCAHPSNVFYFYQEDGQYHLEVHSPYGAKFTPFYEGNVAAVTVAQLVEAETRARALPKQVDFTWPEQNCRVSGAFIECEGGESQFGELARFTSELRSIQTLDYQYQKFLLKVSFKEQGTDGVTRAMLVGDFSPSHCQVSL